MDQTSSSWWGGGGHSVVSYPGMPGDTWIDAEEQFLKLSEEYVFICKMKIIQLGNSCTKEIYKKKPTKETTSNLEKEIPVVPH